MRNWIKIDLVAIVAMMSVAMSACSGSKALNDGGINVDHGSGSDGVGVDVLLVEDGNSHDATSWTCQSIALPGGISLSKDQCVVGKIAIEESRVVALEDSYLWQIAGSPGTTASTITIRRSSLDWTQSQLATPNVTLTHHVNAAVYPSQFFALSSSGTAWVWGYTYPDLTGTVLWGELGSTVPKHQSTAPGNFDAAFFDDNTILVIGLGTNNAQFQQGLYQFSRTGTPRRVMGDLGDNSGYLALNDRFVIVGGYFFSEEADQLYLFSRSQLQTALTQGSLLSATTHGVLLYHGDVIDLAIGDDIAYIVTPSTIERRKIIDGKVLSFASLTPLLTRSSSASTDLNGITISNGMIAIHWKSKVAANDELIGIVATADSDPTR